MSESFYRGLAIRAAGDAHRHVAASLARFVPPPATVLDIAAGTGALAARLRDAGYAVVANDVERSQFAAPDIECLSVDLDRPGFSASLRGPYDAVVAVEIIEHLESPAAFVRECAGLLTGQGKLFVSTPNVESAFVRVQFLRTGRLRWFAPESTLGSEGHLTPIFPWFLALFARRANLRVLDEWCSDPALMHHEMGTLASRIAYDRRVLRLLERYCGAEGGDVRFFVLEHSS